MSALLRLLLAMGQSWTSEDGFRRAVYISAGLFMTQMVFKIVTA
ncbi:hypothetical protein [Rhodobacter capsulatus]|nr:hypothetical protein [Rhodobacter capsulatus]